MDYFDARDDKMGVLTTQMCGEFHSKAEIVIRSSTIPGTTTMHEYVRNADAQVCVDSTIGGLPGLCKKILRVKGNWLK